MLASLHFASSRATAVALDYLIICSQACPIRALPSDTRLSRRNGECHKTHQSYPAPPLGTGRGPKPLPLQPPKARCPKVCALHAEAPRLPCRFSGDRIRPAVEPHTPHLLSEWPFHPFFPFLPHLGLSSLCFLAKPAVPNQSFAEQHRSAPIRAGLRGPKCPAQAALLCHQHSH